MAEEKDQKKTFGERIVTRHRPANEREQAVRQGKTEVVTRRPAGEREAYSSVPRGGGEEQASGLRTEIRDGERAQQASSAHRPDAQQVPQGRPSAAGNAPDAPARRQRPGQMVVGRPKSQKPQEKKPPVIIDSPDIDSKKPDDGGSQKEPLPKEDADGRKFYFQRLREISMLRRMLMLVFGLMALWCMAPMFFHIISIGVVSSTLIMLFVFFTAMFWHLIDRHWTLKKAAVCLAIGALFSAGVIAFGIVSGMMLKASLTAPPSGRSEYTVVVLGCKAHGDQPSWMLSDRLEKAYDVLRKNPRVKCVVTGGRGDDEQYTEAYVMKKYLTEKGISADRIYVEELSESTEENLLYSKALIKINGLSENIVIVTDRFHELRARIWAEKAGFKNIYSACCETRPYLVTGYWFREMFGLARLYVFGR